MSNLSHGLTQNQNESFNGTIWNRIPKHRFVKLSTFEIGVYDAVAHFNVGREDIGQYKGVLMMIILDHFNVGNLASLLIYDAVGVERGYWTVQGCIDDDNFRLNNSCQQSSDIVKSRRRFLRGQRKVKCGKTEKQEGKVYGAGMAS